jgi:hypothetical protein
LAFLRRILEWRNAVRAPRKEDGRREPPDLLPSCRHKVRKNTTPTFSPFWLRFHRPPTRSVHGHVHRKMTSVRLLCCHEDKLVSAIASDYRLCDAEQVRGPPFAFPVCFRPSNFVLPKLPVVSSRRGSFDPLRCRYSASQLRNGERLLALPVHPKKDQPLATRT